MMLHTFEAITDQDGHVRLLEPATLPASRHVLITLLPDPAIDVPETIFTQADDVEHGTITPAYETVDESGTDVVEFFQHSPMYGVELGLG